MMPKSRSAKPRPNSNTIPTNLKNCTVSELHDYVKANPDSIQAWEHLATALIDTSPQEAAETLQQALELHPNHPKLLLLAGKAEYCAGNRRQAQDYFECLVAIRPDLFDVQFYLAKVLYDSAKYEEALQHIEKADRTKPGKEDVLSYKGNILYRLHRFEEAITVFDGLLKKYPLNYSHWNNAANLRRDLGRLKEADHYYRKAASLTKIDPLPFSNLITTLHYRPDCSREEIFSACREWQTRFAPKKPNIRPDTGKSPNRRLRIGMISDGFRGHPVGMMITSALEHLQKREIELFAYSTNTAVDPITVRIQNTANHWQAVSHLTDESLAERIREDQIDILFDLCGHNTGSRMRAVALEPAAIIIKWVGGLINTTGIDAIDYLLTDTIESPKGDDSFYTEKLIRLPDDYICYAPPKNMPSIGELPAFTNGYITLGCFNNPIKINDIVLFEWSRLMHELPNSHLLLKGHQYNSKEVTDRILSIMTGHGISNDRITLQGPSNHQTLLQTYNQIDIALDPWPYSGGLTTCEAMLMGVPVVTLPGPTFAGRHSATHLVNAGMPELVVSNWDEYRERVIGLASDLKSLSTIRTHLRDILLQSPVCDGPRFAKHFSTAMRAVWQRYCESKTPAALTIDKEGRAWFDGDAKPVEIQQPVADSAEEENGFSFSFNGKIIALDNGAVLVGNPQFAELHKLNTFSTIVFDPASKVTNAHLLQQQGELHHFPHTTLGNGQPATLFACLDPAASGTLEPLPAKQQLSDNEKATAVIAKLPVKTQRLDDIVGLENIDWLLLDNLNNSIDILENGHKSLNNTLLVQARINFLSTHHQQPELHLISLRLATHGFRFYRLNNTHHYSYLPRNGNLNERQATQLICADAIFIPNPQRILNLTANERLKLAFLLHTAYGVRDLSYALINTVDTQLAKKYIESLGLIGMSAPRPLSTYTELSLNQGRTESRSGNIKSEHFNENKSRAPARMRNFSQLNSKKQQMKLAVGIPVFNEEKHIEETLSSLISQNTDGVRFLIADNGSSDKTLEIISDILGRDGRFEIFCHDKNIGAVENFKFLFDNTASDYFMWLGGHDYISDNYFEPIISRLDDELDVSMMLGMPHGVMDSKSMLVQDAIYDFQDNSPIQRYIRSVAEIGNCTILQSVFRRKDLDGFEIRSTISWDHVLISRLLWKGKLKYSDNAKYFRRYFSNRESNYHEHMEELKIELSRSDFYNYYRDDFALLTRNSHTKLDIIKTQNSILKILQKRFGQV